jgi:uncharacterized protein with HEPN domain
LKDDKVFIRHILDEVNYLIGESKNLKFEDLMKDETLKKALIRSLEIIGEATKNLSKSFREEHSDINWKELAGLRDKLIHHYWVINWHRAWDVIKNIIPEIENKLKKILEENET